MMTKRRMVQTILLLFAGILAVPALSPASAEAADEVTLVIPSEYANVSFIGFRHTGEYTFRTGLSYRVEHNEDYTEVRVHVTGFDWSEFRAYGLDIASKQYATWLDITPGDAGRTIVLDDSNHVPYELRFTDQPSAVNVENIMISPAGEPYTRGIFGTVGGALADFRLNPSRTFNVQVSAVVDGEYRMYLASNVRIDASSRVHRPGKGRSGGHHSGVRAGHSGSKPHLSFVPEYLYGHLFPKQIHFDPVGGPVHAAAGFYGQNGGRRPETPDN